MRSTCLASIMAMLVSANLAFSAAGAVGGPVLFACRGAQVDAARQLAKDHNLPLGMDSKGFCRKFSLEGPAGASVQKPTVRLNGTTQVTKNQWVRLHMTSNSSRCVV